MTAEAQAPAAEAPSRPDRQTMLVYFGALIAMFMATMDMQIVVTALPTIAGELGNVHLFGWVGAAYLLSTAAVAPFYGKLGDMYGRKNVVLTAIILFLIGSLVCGLAWSMESLIAARVLQGIGGGGLMVSAFAIVGELFGPRERAKYQGYSSAVFTLSSVLGPVAGGYITDFFGWRWVFLVNLPIGIVVVALIAFAMRRRAAPKSHKVDYLGGLLLAVATVAIVYWGDHVLDPTQDWLTFVLPVVGIAAIIGFVMVERRAEEPIIPLRLFRNHTITMVTIVSLIMGVCTLGLFFYFALYIQTITGLGPAIVGFLFLPASATSLVVSIVAGWVIAATGHYKWLPVTAMVIGVALMIGYTFVDAHTPLWVLGLMMAIFGVSMGLQFQVLMVAIQAAAPLPDIGAATGLITQARTVGASLGLAINGAIMTWALTAQGATLPAETAELLPEGLSGLTPHAAAALTPAVRDNVLAHYSAGFDVLFLTIAGLYGLAFVFSLMLKDIEIPRTAIR